MAKRKATAKRKTITRKRRTPPTRKAVTKRRKAPPVKRKAPSKRKPPTQKPPQKRKPPKRPPPKRKEPPKRKPPKRKKKPTGFHSWLATPTVISRGRGTVIRTLDDGIVIDRTERDARVRLRAHFKETHEWAFKGNKRLTLTLVYVGPSTARSPSVRDR